jgi:hypothetical protein
MNKFKTAVLLPLRYYYFSSPSLHPVSFSFPVSPQAFSSWLHSVLP